MFSWLEDDSSGGGGTAAPKRSHNRPSAQGRRWRIIYSDSEDNELGLRLYISLPLM